jgi:hypothetical protein
MNASRITALLGLSPTTSRAAMAPGEASKDQCDKYAAMALWSISTNGVVESKDVDKHIQYLLEPLVARAGHISAVMESGGEGWLDLFLSSDQWNASLKLSSRSVEMSALLGLGIFVDTYPYPGDEVGE